LKHLIYDALFDPGKSGEIRWVLADARDTAASLKTVWESGGSEGKMDLVFNTAGWIPLGGDGLKSGRRVLNEQAEQALKKAAKEIEQEAGTALRQKLDNFGSQHPAQPKTSGGDEINGLGGNPFTGKSAEEIDEMLRAKGFEPVGPNPIKGEGSYFHPKTGRKYYIDKGEKPFKPGPEGLHVDIHQMKDGENLKKTKKKYFESGEIKNGK
jgi:hypothetical protein